MIKLAYHLQKKVDLFTIIIKYDKYVMFFYKKHKLRITVLLR